MRTKDNVQNVLEPSQRHSAANTLTLNLGNQENKFLLSGTPLWGLVSQKLLRARARSYTARWLLATGQVQNPQWEMSWVPSILPCQR